MLLDDAASHEQVRPLLPGTPGSLALITSRRHLSALDDAVSVCLDTLPPDEGAVLLIRLVDRPDLDPADPAIEKINRLCGYLPLAIGMLARQLHHHPAWSAAGLAQELEAARDRLALMYAENLSVGAAFDLSYQDLAAVSNGCSGASACTPGRTLILMLPLPSTALAWRIPAAALASFSTSIWLPSLRAAVINCMT